MKRIIRAFFMAFYMFTAIPCPFCKWNDEARPLVTVFLPAVGAEIGLLWALLAFLLRHFNLPALAGAAALCAFPYLVTGFTHLDGFMDVTDAVKSWRGLEERRRILKDPLAGSFAVAACVVLVLLGFALFASAKSDADFIILIFIPIVSRCMSGLAVTVLRPMSTSQYSGTYQKGIKKSHVAVLAAALAAACALSFFCCGVYGFASTAVIAGYLFALRRGFKSLDGMSGDIAGYSLTVAELCGVAVYALI